MPLLFSKCGSVHFAVAENMIIQVVCACMGWKPSLTVSVQAGLVLYEVSKLHVLCYHCTAHCLRCYIDM
jgi:hypothetical protein